MADTYTIYLEVGKEGSWKAVTNPSWETREGEYGLYIDCIAHNLSADKSYYARLYCGDERIATCTLKPAGETERGWALFATETDVDNSCTPLPFDADVVLTDESEATLDSVTRTIPAKEEPTCEEGDHVVLEYCPDGSTEKRWKDCVNGEWVHGSQECHPGGKPACVDALFPRIKKGEKMPRVEEGTPVPRLKCLLAKFGEKS